MVSMGFSGLSLFHKAINDDGGLAFLDYVMKVTARLKRFSAIKLKTGPRNIIGLKYKD